MQRKHCTLSWDSIGTYLEWGSVPSAHNGDANWAAKYREKSSPCQICEHGKSPACQIWFRYCYTSYLFRLPMLFCSTIHASTIEWEKTRKSLWRQIWIDTSQVVSMSPNLCFKKVVSIYPTIYDIAKIHACVRITIKDHRKMHQCKLWNQSREI